MTSSGTLQEFDHVIKIVFVGNSAVGKSSMILRFTEGQFDPGLAATIGVDFKLHLVDFKQRIKVNLSIWDTAGQEKFHSMTGSYYRGAHAVFVVYDVSNRQSFEHLKTWLEEIDLYETNKVVKVLIANKIDVSDRVVSESEGKIFAKQHKLLFMECSSKDDIHVNDAFELLINAVLDDPDLAEASRPSDKKMANNVRIQPQENQGQAGGCSQYC
jgi:Ras-related protein Rab-18